MIEWLRFIVAAIFILGGLIVAGVATYGVFRFKFTLNRMNAAALNDTLAILFVLLGLIIIKGIQFESLKLLCIILFLWFASPVNSHLLAKLEVTVEKRLKEECEVID